MEVYGVHLKEYAQRTYLSKIDFKVNYPFNYSVKAFSKQI